MVYALYMLQFKRFRRTRKLIEDGGPNGTKKSVKLKPWASKVPFFEIFIDFGKLAFCAELTNKSTSGRHDAPEKVIFHAHQ